MKVERTKNAKRNIMWGFLCKVVSIILSFMTRTVMIYVMGMDYVGLGSLFSSILQVLSFAELGIGGAMVFSMYKPIAENDDDKVCALLNLYRSIYRVIGIIILVAGMLLMPFLDHMVAGDVPVDINLYILFGIYLLNNVLGYFLFAYKSSLFQASQRLDITSKIGMIFQLVSSIAHILVLVLFRNYYMYVVVIPVFTVLNNVLVGYLSYKQFPQYRCRGNISKEERDSIKKKVGGMLFQKMGSIVLQSADTIIISAFLGLRILGIYNGYYYIITTLFGFISIIQSSLVPSIGNSIVTEKIEKNLKDFKKFHFLYMWIVMWCCSCLLCLYQPFIKLWQGSENVLPDIMVLLLTIYFFANKMGDICCIYRESIGLWWEAKFIPFTSSIVNLCLNIALVKIIGLPGIVISTIVSLVFINLPWGSKVLFSKYFKSGKEYWRYLINTARYFILMCVTAGITYLVCSAVLGEGLIALILKGIVCAILPNIILIVINIKNPDFKVAGQFVLRLIPQKFVPDFVVKLVK